MWSAMEEGREGQSAMEGGGREGGERGGRWGVIVFLLNVGPTCSDYVEK